MKLVPLRSKKGGRFEKLVGFARSHSIVTRGSVSLSCATTPHPTCLSKSLPIPALPRQDIKKNIMKKFKYIFTQNKNHNIYEWNIY